MVAALGVEPTSNEQETADLRSKLGEAQADLSNLEDDVEDVADDLADTAEVDVDEYEAPIERLRAAANSIKDEYESLQETIENAAKRIFSIIDVKDDKTDEDPSDKLSRALKDLGEDYGSMEADTEVESDAAEGYDDV